MYFSNYVNMDMEKFLKGLCNAKYSYVVLMDRKMYSLYASYGKPLVEKYLNSEVRIISSSALPYYVKDMDNVKVLIVDDILIHGRTMKKIWNQLFEYAKPPASIDCSVLVVDEGNIDEIHRGKELKNLTYRLALDRENWRRISRQIVNRIRGTLTPLRAAVAYGIWKTDLLEETLANDVPLRKLQEYDPDFKEVRTYISENLLDVQNESGMVEKIIVRFDYSSSIPNTVLVVPQVFLKPLKNSDAIALFRELLNGLSEEVVWDEMSPESICRYLEYCSSQWAMKKIKETLAERYIISENNFAIHDHDLEYCFSSSLTAAARKKEFFQVFSRILEKDISKYPLEENPGNIMESILKKRPGLCDPRTYMRYLCECGFADELLNELHEVARIEGARLDYLIKKHFLQYESVIYAMLMSISTYSYKSVSGWTTLRVIPGEQAFSYFLFADKEVFEKAQDLLDDYKNDRADENEETVGQLVGQFGEIIGELNVRDELFDIIDSLCDYFRQRNRECRINNDVFTQLKYIQYMTDIGIPRVFKND